MDDLKQLIENHLANHNALMLATTGGEYSPWILGVYYFNDGLDIYFFLETNGKSMGNVRNNNSVAISVSQNDAMKDFLQGYGKIEVLPDDKEKFVRDGLVAKMPWFQTYTPVSPVKVKIEKSFFTSLERQWFPAKVLENQ
ncbi:MAG TPA: pyridoxamine 5'-phosphate oxidase family protein [Ignavibacteria bacterium]|nr:pyridoxamine 5'-phosphate oxidase family protein [Ignavibacteria bacterium]